MAKRYSRAWAHAVTTGSLSLSEIVNNSVIQVYSGSQPTLADDSPTANGSVLLCTFTSNSGTFTTEKRATGGTLTLSGTNTGSIDSLSVLGINIMSSAVSCGASFLATAQAIVDNINGYKCVLPIFAKVTASSGSDATITLYPAKGAFPTFNSATVAVTKTGAITATAAAFSTDGAAAANGLQFLYNHQHIDGTVDPVTAACGILVKSATAWSGVAVQSGTATWFRMLAGRPFCETTGTTTITDFDDGGEYSSSSQIATFPFGKFLRHDGTIGTAGADVTVSNASITSGATQTFNDFRFTYSLSQ